MHNRSVANTLNPLIGHDPRETLENLCICLAHLGETFASHHEDPSIHFFAVSAAAALRYEAEQIEQQAA
ncbi:hypothetical protein [Chromobacterium amazonense]|uniref:DUF3077 domain-containing protein n=1 Tax=Chromobacterium amazonense TaxID=1382803 RepID=A0ABU8V2G0_9NEIS|nr:hypothetical protein [Chromobacterium amazonense]MDQ4540734.1 hypothetical protein [Chromobacterium amazonense]